MVAELKDRLLEGKLELKEVVGSNVDIIPESELGMDNDEAGNEVVSTVDGEILTEVRDDVDKLVKLELDGVIEDAELMRLVA